MKLNSYYLVLLSCMFASCGFVKKQTVSSSVAPSQKLIAQVKKDWINYQLYQLSDTTVQQQRSRLFAIRIVNTADNYSPLRKLSSNLEAYNTMYAYLLNQAKYDLLLQSDKGKQYACSYYAFENNYNAFPFDAMTIGFTIEGKKRYRHAQQQIQYIDHVFTQDTILFQLPKASH